MRSKLFATLTVALMVLSLHGTAQASRVTNNSYEDSFPQIKGDYLVWQGYVDTGWEIFLYNIPTKEISQITSNNYDDISPQTDGNYIVWQGFKVGEWDIFIWDGGEPQTISDPAAQDYSPQIANGVIVWTSEPMGTSGSFGPGEIMIYDTQSPNPAPRLLYANDDWVDPGNTLEDSAPKINDEVVIWIQTDAQGNITLFMYDLSNGSITQNPDYVWRDSPQIDGNLRVLIRHDGHDGEIFLYNSTLKSYHQITDNGLNDRYPRISGNHIAWMAAGEIFITEIPNLLVSITPDTIVVEGQEKVKVIVTDGEGKEVRGATVTLSGCGVDETEVTDKNGKVKFKNVNPSQIGTIQVTVSKDGHSDYIGSITVNEAK